MFYEQESKKYMLLICFCKYYGRYFHCDTVCVVNNAEVLINHVIDHRHVIFVLAVVKVAKRDVTAVRSLTIYSDLSL